MLLKLLLLNILCFLLASTCTDSICTQQQNQQNQFQSNRYSQPEKRPEFVNGHRVTQNGHMYSVNANGHAGGQYGSYGIGGQASFQANVAPGVNVGPYVSGGYGGNRYGSGGSVGSYGIGATWRF